MKRILVASLITFLLAVVVSFSSALLLIDRRFEALEGRLHLLELSKVNAEVESEEPFVDSIIPMQEEQEEEIPVVGPLTSQQIDAALSAIVSDPIWTMRSDVQVDESGGRFVEQVVDNGDGPDKVWRVKVETFGRDELEQLGVGNVFDLVTKTCGSVGTRLISVGDKTACILTSRNDTTETYEENYFIAIGDSQSVQIYGSEWTRIVDSDFYQKSVVNPRSLVDVVIRVFGQVMSQ